MGSQIYNFTKINFEIFKNDLSNPGIMGNGETFEDVYDNMLLDYIDYFPELLKNYKSYTSINIDFRWRKLWYGV